MLFVLCYPEPVDEAFDRIEAFRRVHEPDRAALVRAHITLVFGVRGIAAPDLLSRVRAAARDERPFDLTLTRAAVHRDPARGEHKVLLMVGRGRSRLTRLHRALHEGPLEPELRGDVSFRPHVTVATAPSAELARAALEAARDLPLPILGRVKGLSLARLEGGVLHPVAEITFGGDQA